MAVNFVQKIRIQFFSTSCQWKTIYLDKSIPLKNLCFCALRHNADSPKVLKSAMNSDLTQYSNSILSVTTGLLSSVSMESITLVIGICLEKQLFWSLHPQPISPKIQTLLSLLIHLDMRIQVSPWIDFWFLSSESQSSFSILEKWIPLKTLSCDPSFRFLTFRI